MAVPDVSDWREQTPAGKWSQFFGALSKQMSLAEVIQPRLNRPAELLNLAASFHPDVSKWRRRAGFNMRQASRLSAEVERELSRRAGSFDLVVQLQTLCSPGSDFARRPYVIYTDNTFALTLRLYPRGDSPSSSRVRRRLAFEQAICRSATAVFTTSEYARRSVIEDYGCPPSQVAAIGAGANQLLESLTGKQYGKQLALFVGMQFDRKGGPTLLDAWRAVRARLPDAELVIAGPSAPPPNLGPGVTWVGRVDRARLEELYAEASVFVLPSIFEPWGFVFAEAMGHGLPCIGTACCAMPEMIDDGVTGRLVPPGEAGPLAEALIELLADPEKTEDMGRAAYARVLEQFTWGHMAERFFSHLAALGVSPSRPSAAG